MAKKKKKIVVDLDLPKNDSTSMVTMIIIFISLILGASSGLFWLTNSGFVPTANGEPMFTNFVCGATTGNEVFMSNLVPCCSTKPRKSKQRESLE